MHAPPRPRLCASVRTLSLPAAALVGGATVVRDTGAGRHIVMIVGTRGNLCTGTALARDLVLTAGHCVRAAPRPTACSSPTSTPPGLSDPPASRCIRATARTTMPRGRVTADVALIKLADAAAGNDHAGRARRPTRPVAAGDRLTCRGLRRRPRAAATAAPATARQAALIATGRPGTLQIRLVDPATGGARAGLGACTGDSGAPAFVENAGRYRRDRRGELVDRPGRHRRLRRPDRRHAARAAPRLDRRAGAEDGQSDRAVTWIDVDRGRCIAMQTCRRNGTTRL